MKELIDKMLKWVNGLVSDENGAPSSKRIMGLISGFSLCVALFLNIFTDKPVDGTLVNAVAALAFGTLGLSSVDKIWGYKTTKEIKETKES